MLASQSPSPRHLRRTALPLVGLILLICLLTGCPKPTTTPAPPPTSIPAEAIRHNNLGVALMDIGVKDPQYFLESLREFEEALELAPDYTLARINLGIGCFYAARAARSGEEQASFKQRAREALLEAEKSAPDSPRVHYVLGLMDELAGRYEEAEKRFEKVVAADPDEPYAWYHLGMSRKGARRYQDSLEPLRKAAQLRPYNRAFRYNLFQALVRAGKRDEGKADWDAFLALPARGIRVTETKDALAYLSQGKYAEAAADGQVPEPTAPPAARPEYRPANDRLGESRLLQPIEVDARIRDLQADDELRWEEVAGTERVSAALAIQGGAVVWLDVNDDGRWDLLACSPTGAVALYVQGDDYRFSDQAATWKLESLPRFAMDAVAGDYDNDGRVDLCLGGYGWLRLLRNTGQHFEDVTAAAGLKAPVTTDTWIRNLSFADVDHDGDLDIFAVTWVDLSKPGGDGKSSSPFGGKLEPNLLFRNNRDGTFTETAAAAGVALPDRWYRGALFSDVNDDRAVDLVLVGADFDANVFLNAKDGTFIFSPEESRDYLDPFRQREPGALADFDNDGDLDRATYAPAKGLQLQRNDQSATHWLKVRVKGYVAGGKVKSNSMAIGARAEVRSVGLWQVQELRGGRPDGGMDAPELRFDLGDAERVDFVRVVFPSGVRWTERDVAADQTVTIEEPLLDSNSCPALFVWNGRRFDCVTDVISAGILGELEAPGRYWQPDPDEWLRVPGDRWRPRSTDGESQLELRFVNPLEEVTYLDHARLLVIDHRAGLEAHPNERMVGEARNRPPQRFFLVGDLRPAKSAFDVSGHQVAAALRRVDRWYAPVLRPLPFKGFAEDWSLTLDLDRDLHHPVLLLEGWSYWNSSASMVAAAQAGRRLWGPQLQACGADGRWRTLTDDMGVFAGLPRSITIDLRGKLQPGDRRLRIRSNRTLYIDAARMGEVTASWQPDERPPVSLAVVTSAPMTAARLRWCGYPRRRLPDGRLPEVYDYGDRGQHADWGLHIGCLTRYGEVKDLLARRDDRFVIMEHGEEIAIRFDARRLPPLPQGWRRTYMLYFVGYEKGYEIHSGASQTVEPLPYADMPEYPYTGLGRGADTTYLEWLHQWNTRPSYARWN